MTKSLAFYFHVHQPYRVREYSVFDIGHSDSYFDVRDDSKLNNEKMFHKVARKSYWPMVTTLQKLLNDYPGFKFSLSITGDFIEQAEAWAPDLLDAFRSLVASGRVEIVGETYYHSLAFFYDISEFETQVKLHADKINEVFGVTPTAFRNTELAYNDNLARWADSHGYKTILAEGWDPILDWRSPNYVYSPVGTNDIRLLLKNYKLSDDIAFRFADKSWNEWPLTADKYIDWLHADSDGQIINLFMDFETFGEHQWEETGIMDFFTNIVSTWSNTDDNSFTTVTEAAENLPESGEISMPDTVTWADSERDLSAWSGNSMQQEALTNIYELGRYLKHSDDTALVRDWRLLQSSDHFYYMATKWDKDGDVHKYFSPYQSPYDAFLYYMNTLRSIRYRVMKAQGLVDPVELATHEVE